MLHVFIIRAAGSELDGEPFEINDTDVIRASARAAAKVADIFSLASPARRATVRAEYVATFPSRRAYEAAEESGVSMTPAMADAVLDCLLGEELAACPMVMPCIPAAPTCGTCAPKAAAKCRHDFRDGDVCSKCDAMRGAA